MVNGAWLTVAEHNADANEGEEERGADEKDNNWENKFGIPEETEQDKKAKRRNN